MALKDLVSNLSNFKGQSQYDGLDSQIKEGVDYFPDDTSGAKGFTPNTDLLTKYNKFMKDVRQNNTLPNQYDGQANISAPNAGVRENFKSRRAYGSLFEYSEPEGVGISKTSHIFSNDNQLGIKVQPQFNSDFMTTPVADYVSKLSPPENISKTYDLIPNTYNRLLPNYTEYSNEFAPIGGSVFRFANLLPRITVYRDVTQRFSNYSTEVERFKDGEYKTPKGFGGIQRTLQLSKEAFRRTETSKLDNFKSVFTVETIDKIYEGSRYIKDLFEFKDGLGRDTFKNVPAGINDLGKFGTADFRTVANKGPFDGNSTHPIILRKPGSNWDNVLNESVIGGTAGDVVAGALGVVGLLTRTSRDLADKSRVFRFLISSKGISFVAKQFAFQALNPTIESKIYNPLSTLGIAGASDLLSGDVRGLLRAAGSFLFPTHVDRHLGGLKYHGLETSALQLAGTTAGEPDGRLQYFARAFAPQTNAPEVDTGFSLLDDYANGQIDGVQGGLFFTRANPNKYAFPISTAPKKVVDGRPHFLAGPLEAKTDFEQIESKVGGTFNRDSAIVEGTIHKVDSYSELLKKARDDDDDDRYEKMASRGSINNFGKTQPETKNDYNINNNIGKPGHSGDISIASGEDKINMLPYGLDYNQTADADLKDFIKFRFYDITNDKFIIFRAILEAITDTVTPNYSEENYIGRPDKVFVYQNVDRTLSFTFSIYPKTKQELPVLMKKLNHLVGLCYPTFSQTERMQAPFMELTMGDMFVDTPGILTGLTVTVEEQSTWEIDEGLQFPHFIKAACEFRHIGKYIPDARGKHYDLPSIQDVERVNVINPSTAPAAQETTTLGGDGTTTGQASVPAF